MKIKGTTAIVTGGARGIGRGVALALAREGANIVVGDVPVVRADADEAARLVGEAGAQALAVECDVTHYEQVSAMVDAARERFGRIDILVNNAGVISVAPVAAMTEEQWDRVIDVNLKGTFFCAKAVAPHLMQQRSGRIVNMSSQAGRRGSPALAHYCTSKFGVIGFTQSLALELASFNVTVNAICPGEVDTAMWQETLLPAIAAARGISKGEAWDAFMRDRVPLGRPQSAEDIGQAVVFLCKADNVTGEAINVTGGSELV
jgi:meso-butanediol dehydrogenase / (S,S)-butanediol dehydrogenase / diacetyl reductase